MSVKIIEVKSYGRLSNFSSRSIDSSISDLGASSEFEMIGNEEILKDLKGNLRNILTKRTICKINKNEKYL